jgi:molecular chaperone GrpE
MRRVIAYRESSALFSKELLTSQEERLFKKECTMQQDGQEKWKHAIGSKKPGQFKQRGEANPTIISNQEEQTTITAQQREKEQNLATEQQRAEAYLDQLQRTQADFINYRRRVNKELSEGRIAAQSMLLSHLLPVFDDLELALRAAPAEMFAHPWVQGLFLVAQRLRTLLNQLGVQRIGAVGEPFDPRWHEAVTTEARANVAEGTILDVVQSGYVLGERVIRPARVVVAQSFVANERSNGQ